MIYGSTSVVNMHYRMGTKTVGRSTMWGNPHRVDYEIDRADALAGYLHYLARSTDLLARVGELRGHKLGCWCAPRACHAVYLALLAEGVPFNCLELFQ